MSSSLRTGAGIVATKATEHLNPAELKIDLFCCGMRIDGTCRLEEEGRPIGDAGSDLASGLEIILPGEMRELWANVPVREKFVETSPYCLRRTGGKYQLHDARHDLTYDVRLAPKPAWYDLRTTRGIAMSQIGMLQGTCLTIALGEQCHFWNEPEASRCRFGGAFPHGSADGTRKTIADVVETVAMAQKMTGITMTFLHGGYRGPNGLTTVFPYLKALKQEVGILVGVQFPAEMDLDLYDRALSLGIDHVSFRIDYYNQDYFQLYAPGKAKALGQKCYFQALEHCTRLMGKGRVSGIITAGIEPIDDSLRAIDYFVAAGALPLVGVFRPGRRTDMEGLPPPHPDEMLRVFCHVYDACRARNLPVGITPNVHVSVMLHPADTLYLAPDSSEGRSYRNWILTVEQVMRPYFVRRMRKRRPQDS